MGRGLGLVFLLALMGCGAQPAPQLFGAERFDVTRAGRHYVVYRKGQQVEVIRLGWAAAGAHQEIRAQMIGLIPEVTGCRLRESALQGDSGEMRGLVTCPPHLSDAGQAYLPRTRTMNSM